MSAKEADLGFSQKLLRALILSWTFLNKLSIPAGVTAWAGDFRTVVPVMCSRVSARGQRQVGATCESLTQTFRMDALAQDTHPGTRAWGDGRG